MSEVWAIIASIIIVMVIFAYISSKIASRKRKKLREKTLPFVAESIQPNVVYDVHLSDGRIFEKITIVGSIEGDDNTVSFAGYEGVLVLKKTSDEKRVFVKKSSVRFISEI